LQQTICLSLEKFPLIKHNYFIVKIFSRKQGVQIVFGLYALFFVIYCTIWALRYIKFRGDPLKCDFIPCR